MISRILPIILLSLLAFACQKKEKECFQCKSKMVIEIRSFNDTVYVYKNDREIGRCKPTKAERDKKERAMKETAAEQNEYLRAYRDSSYDGFYTGKRSIDTEEDLLSMLDKENDYPFKIRMYDCEHFSKKKD